MNIHTAPVLVTKKAEAARSTGLSYSTIVRLVKRGQLHEVQLAPGMHPRLRLEDILSLADSSERDVGP